MSRWIAKALAQKAISVLPFSEGINHQLQRRLRKSLPMSDAVLAHKVEQAKAHFAHFTAYAQAPPDKAVFYEFGAGYELVVPLVYCSMGVRRQIVDDYRPHMRPWLVRDALMRLGMGDHPAIGKHDLYELYGIAYRAPADARHTGLADASVDFISNTDTLEHIPQADLAAILRECKRVLKPGAVISCDIGPGDHFSYFDKSIPPYNFLRFGPLAWGIINSPLQYQNRLRPSDYVAAFEAAGYRIVRTRSEGAAVAPAAQVAPQFKRYPPEELASTRFVLVAQKL